MRINSIQVVTEFERDSSILLNCGPLLKEIEKKYKGKIFTVNTPEDAPPSLPRAVLRLEDTILNIGQNRFEITMSPPKHVVSEISESFQFANRRTNNILSHLAAVMPPYQWSGVVTEVEYPEVPIRSKSGIEAATPIFDALVRIDRQGRDLSALELQFGFKEEDYFIIYRIHGFESRQFAVPKGMPGNFVVDLGNFPLERCGIEIVVDINNKPKQKKSDPIADISALYQQQITAIENLGEKLNIQGIIQ